MEKRIEWMDGIRVIACLMVILIHAPMPSGENNDAAVAFLSYATVSCIPLFFMLSGALIFPVKQPISDFIKRRLFKLIIPLLIWSVLTLGSRYLIGEISHHEVLRSLLLIPFVNVEGVYWYIYTAIGLYLFAPIISLWLENSSRRLIEWYLFFWSVTLLLPYFESFFPGIFNISYYTPLYAFTGFAGYMVLGYYLNKYGFNLKSIIEKRPVLGITTGFIFILTLIWPPFLYFLRRRYNMVIVLNSDLYLVLHAAVMAIVIFLIIKNYYTKISFLHSWVSRLAPLTFGIYLCHIFIMREIIWPLMRFIPSLNSFGAALLIAFFTFILSAILVMLLRKLPYSKYIIGYS